MDHTRRSAIRANHSATHLLHEALRRALGDHVAQRGSLVSPDRLRFDFAHVKAMSPEELAKVESEVNTFVRQNTPVDTRIMTPDAAQEIGARALFGEKYGDEVRVVSMGTLPGSGIGTSKDTYSLELCGGTHVKRTGEIGAFLILSENGTSSGVRRIEATTAENMLKDVRQSYGYIDETASALYATPDQMAAKVRELQRERKAQAQEIADLQRKLAMACGPAAGGPETVNGVPFLAQILTDVPKKQLPGLIDEYKAKIGTGIVVLVSNTGPSANVAVGVTNDLTASYSAVEIVRVVAAVVGGKGGGGRPELAQAGGPDATKAPEAIAAAKALLKP